MSIDIEERFRGPTIVMVDSKLSLMSSVVVGGVDTLTTDNEMSDQSTR